jgi:hypothetical protein
MKAVLNKPVVGVQLDTRIAETLPSGSEIEVAENSPNGWADISCKGSSFSVFRQDLLDACSVDDVQRITFAGVKRTRPW